MTAYKEKVILHSILLVLCCIILAVFCFLGFAGELGWAEFMTPSVADSHWQSRWRGFVSGASFGVLALMVYGLVRNLRALKDEKKLKQLYIKENDERQQVIYSNALRSAMQTGLILGLSAVVISGYFSIIVSLTLLVSVLTLSLLCVGFKWYYSKIM